MTGNTGAVMELEGCTFGLKQAGEALWLWGLQPFLSDLNRNHWAERGTGNLPQYVILHHTVLDLRSTLRLFSRGVPSRVSAHYVIAEEEADGLRHVEAGTVFQIVDDQNSAWHAGSGAFGAVPMGAMNPCSLGIELVNRTLAEDQESPIQGPIQWLPFSAAQIRSLAQLLRYLLTKHRIPAHCIVGHQDVDPARKLDPGPLFPWRQLYCEYGLGPWVELHECPTLKVLEDVGRPFSRDNFLQALYAFGYRKEPEFEAVVIQAFQAHFIAQGNPKKVTGVPTKQQYRIICALVQKYCSSTHP